MRIVNKEIAEQFVGKHADAQSALNRWIQIVEDANWKTHTELKQLFPSADYVGNSRYVFNIKGNRYRLVAIVMFIAGIAIIRFIGTHTAYDKIDCSTI